ncbi:hypothetical protein [Metabacillus sediminilitoris]|uniref:hypothetical protein n=1 Tax=Metabacillus sediminilitoris TaxID=2567941 RepID=UPI0012D726BD|nr:hypothetical protein [Metabacillus sediminilitoris]QGQ48216.1 hypothetical protein GMB29_24900 [Metabacillus sediminilitoris]
MINIGDKMNTLFWTAIIGLILTTIYSIVIVQQGIKTKKMITFIYQNISKKSTRNLA